MPFAFTHTAPRKPRTQRLRHDRLPVPASARKKLHLLFAQRGESDTLGVILSAACLWFESLDRSVQIAAITACCHSGDTGNVSVLQHFSDRVRSWSFPLFTLGRVLASAIAGFCLLAEAEQQEWIHEVYQLAGDPRQAAGEVPA